MFPWLDEDWKEILIDEKAPNAEKCSINACYNVSVMLLSIL